MASMADAKKQKTVECFAHREERIWPKDFEMMTK